MLYRTQLSQAIFCSQREQFFHTKQIYLKLDK